MPRESLQQELDRRRLQRATRRHFIKSCATGLGSFWLASQAQQASASATGGGFLLPSGPAKRVIYLHMVGAPSQLELFDYKPELARMDGELCPESFIEGKRFAFLQGRPRMLGPVYPFQQHGESGHWFSDRLPNMARCARRLLCHQDAPDRPVQPRPGPANGPRGPGADGVPVDRLVGHVGPRLGERGPAGLHRPALGGPPATRRQGALERGLPALGLPRRAVPREGRPGPQHRQPRRRAARRPPRDARRARRTQRTDLRRVRRPGNAHPDRTVRARLPHAVGRARRDGPVARVGRDARAVRRVARRRVVREQLPARPPAGRAGRAVHPALRLGLGHTRVEFGRIA